MTRDESAQAKVGGVDLPSVTPLMGPFPLRDDFGALPAVALQDRSADSLKGFIQTKRAGDFLESNVCCH